MSTSSKNPNLEIQSKNNNSGLKIKQTRNRSRAYRRRRALKRRKQSLHRRKVIQKYLKNKSNRLEMLNDVKENCDIGVSVRGKNEMVAFWKSKAISLKYENEMLVKHIEDLYRQIILSKTSNYVENQNYVANQEQEGYDEELVDEDEAIVNSLVEDEVIEDETEVADEVETNKKNEYETSTSCEFPKLIENKRQRESEMNILYGKSFRKIMGMETVVQMQYDVLLDKEKINYWPVLPIKL